jgi:hypothetical protein
MKDFWLILVIIVLVGGAVCGYLALFSNPTDDFIGGGLNSFSGDVRHIATSTTSALPVEVASTSPGRRYARIENISDTAIFLNFGTFDSPVDASTTISVDRGIRLNTVGTVDSVYEINPDNLYLGGIWATSTAASKKLLLIEK